MRDLDIVIPVLNERGNLEALFARIHSALTKEGIKYRLIVIDDHSADGTAELVKNLSKSYPVIYRLKKGKQGKAYSILEGSRLARSENIAMIDADLQYPPESIPQMLLQMESDPEIGIVIGERKLNSDLSFVRKFVSKVSRFVNGKLIMGLNFDVQSGLKLFKKEIIEDISTDEVYPWAIDIPLINETQEHGYKVSAVDIDFAKRGEGRVKINILKATHQILWGAIKVRFRPKKIYKLVSRVENTMIEAGFIYKRKRFITHSTLQPNKSAIKTVTAWQKRLIIFTISIALISLIAFPKTSAIVIMAILTLIYFSDVLFNLYLVFKSLNFPPEITFSKKQIDALTDEELPVYTILSPLYREGNVFQQFVDNITQLDYPKEKLDVILLLEVDDKETHAYLKDINLPDYFRVLIVPDSEPKTKPKACNYGLNHARGEYVVIYDAEDRPAPDQLKKAYLGFKQLGDKYACLQAKLNYYNPHQNVLTRLFTAEYSLWFDIILPALQSIDTTIPLGGTSNHFRTQQLMKLEGWDPFNVTEDADLGVRLFKEGSKTAIIDSITLEEANSNLKNWIRQRSRWLKGYMQTFLVHMRNPVEFFKAHKQHFIVFQLIAGLRISFMLINPFMWALTLSYFLFNKYIGESIESIFPPPVFYMAIISAVFGNFLYVYYYMIGAAKREQWGIVKYILLIPVYWLFTSIAGFVALWQLITRPYFWEKTVHGLYIPENEQKKLRGAFLYRLRSMGFNGVAAVKQYLKKEYVFGAFLIVATLAGNFFGFLYNIYLGRKLSLEDFGLIGLFGSFVYITNIITAALGRTLTHKTAYLFGKYGGPIKQAWSLYRRRLTLISLAIFVIWITASPILNLLFKSDGLFPYLIFSPVWIMGIAGTIDSSFLAGNLMFGPISGIVVFEPIIKFVVTYIFVETGLHGLVYLAIPVSVFMSFGLTYLFARSVKGVEKEISEGDVVSFPKKFFYTSFISNLSTIVFLSIDIIIAKLYLSPYEAGLYTLLSVVGKIVYFASTLFSQFIIPYASKENGEGKVGTLFYKLLGLIMASTIGGVLVFGIFGYITVPLLMGEKALPIVAYLPLYSLGVALHSITINLVTFNQAKKKFLFPVAGFFLSLFTVIGMVVFHSSVWDLVRVVFSGGLINIIGIILIYYFYSEIHDIVNNAKDFLGLFQKITAEDSNTAGKRKGKLNILVFNWRDKRHVWSGGAEVYIHEISKRLVANGHIVTLFCGNDGQSPRNEKVDGVQMIRRGGFYTVFLWAALYYIFKLRFYTDVIVDSENGIPFFTPLYAKKKILLLIHHVHQDVFRMRLKPPLSWIGKMLEKQVMPLVYSNTEIVTVSPSSKADILENKITSKEPHVVYNGVDSQLYIPGKKSRVPLVLYLGRLSPQKSLPIFINIARKIVDNMPKVKFVIAGDGEERIRLTGIVNKMGLEKNVTFTGKVSEEEKIKLYQKAWVFVNPSLVEGWGITTIEANACGVPVVASNVAGLRDAVHNPHSGFLVPYGDIEEFSDTIVKLLKNGRARSKMNKEAIEWSRKFNWQKSAEQFESLL